MKTDKTTTDKYTGAFMRVTMKQDGEPGGNSERVEFTLEADQPVAVRLNGNGHPVITITGTQEINDFIEGLRSFQSNRRKYGA